MLDCLRNFPGACTGLDYLTIASVFAILCGLMVAGMGPDQ